MMGLSMALSMDHLADLSIGLDRPRNWRLNMPVNGLTAAAASSTQS